MSVRLAELLNEPLPLLAYLKMLIQRDSVISWPSHSSSCYLSLLFLRHAPALRLLCWQNDPTWPLLSITILLPPPRPAPWSCVCVCVCRQPCLCVEWWCIILFLISPSPLPKAEMICVYACRTLSGLLSYFHCRCFLLFQRHIHIYALLGENKVTLWIRLPCSAREGHKAPDRFTVSDESCWNDLSSLCPVLYLQEVFAQSLDSKKVKLFF